MTELIRGLHNLKNDLAGSVVTIGNFDGIHLGHQALIKKLNSQAKKMGLSSTVVIFEPQPLEFFKPDKVVPRLMRMREKFYALSAYGVDRVLVLKFNKELANITPEAFIKTILINKLNTKYVIVGDDFHFGKNRKGTIEDLQKAGLTVEQMTTFLVNNRRISSTWVREALEAGDHILADKLLNRPYTMMGRIVYGDKLGRVLGFPTANIYLHRAKAPLHGIYAVKMHGIAQHPMIGVANIGTRPAVGGTRTILEVHLFNFNQEIYKRYVTVEFCKKFRDEKYYPNLELLKDQIQKDVEDAKHYFSSLLGSADNTLSE